MADTVWKEERAAHKHSASVDTTATGGSKTVIDRGVSSHRLNRPWTLWYDSVSTYDSQKWELSLVNVATVRTVEEFFTMLHHCKPPHVLRVSAQYHFFREGVKPMWEDPNNHAGGKLWVSLDEKMMADLSNKKRDGRNEDSAVADSANHGNGKGRKEMSDEDKKSELDLLWENVLIAMVGENLEVGVEGDHIMGVVFSKRKYHNRLALWLKDASAIDAVSAIEKQLVKETGLPPSVRFVFTPHSGNKN
ncbi:putative Eukaryotic initiation factor 4E [Trypanosoma vivax]|nr:eukaryotic translation initiation factor 4E [Trypanosoma vivax]KAH8617956.1 putative Eukaryotic initiation factor 4E [Trypanosoma vivax]